MPSNKSQWQLVKVRVAGNGFDGYSVRVTLKNTKKEQIDFALNEFHDFYVDARKSARLARHLFA